MNLVFKEKHTENVGLSIAVKRQLYSGESEFQLIEVFESEDFGCFLALDGYMMLTEKDEFIYHEMIVHVPMSVHPNPKNVLIIGGGDGGAIRELCHYKTVEHIDLVEIDEQVVEVCKKYLPGVSYALDDPRVDIHYEDGLRYIRRYIDHYDLIIVDSTDPFGPGEGLFTKEFYGGCYKALKEDGILSNQHESPFYSADAFAVKQIHKRVIKSFPLSRIYQAYIPTYPSGHWLFGFTSKKYHPVKDLDCKKWERLGIKTRYYNTRLHKASFALPTYVEELIKEVE